MIANNAMNDDMLCCFDGFELLYCYNLFIDYFCSNTLVFVSSTTKIYSSVCLHSGWKNNSLVGTVYICCIPIYHHHFTMWKLLFPSNRQFYSNDLWFWCMTVLFLTFHSSFIQKHYVTILVFMYEDVQGCGSSHVFMPLFCLFVICLFLYFT